MDVIVASEIDRRAWAVEQAVSLVVGLMGMPSVDKVDPGPATKMVADDLLAYLHKPLVEADARLLAALRGYDGTQDAGNLIGMAADALERR